MIELVKVAQVKALDGQRLWVRFSKGWEGVRDLSDVLAEGGSMVDRWRIRASAPRSHRLKSTCQCSVVHSRQASYFVDQLRPRIERTEKGRGL